ncbi:small, acid-soluble spore protein, alpha/beta type [Dethiothermospora halolimnae]|uniref:small, acid-soluble spore protein, alpha/beta type n=1 Tax=Dethiothermospora halolimnae TaxID=3114390 RepID=UPI003CCB8A21
MKNTIPTNARKAFENFKEEIASEMHINSKTDRKALTQEIVKRAKDEYSNLGRS